MRATYKNTLLQAFDEQTLSRLRLKSVSFEVGHEIEFPGQPIDHLFFLEEGMASLTTTFLDGSQVEAGMFGYESVIGVSGLMGTRQSLNRVYTQIEGWGYQCTLEAGRLEFARCGLFQRLALRYVQAQLVQAIQSAGCNARHQVEQRLARWLLICADRVHRDKFRMSQEFLSEMIGSTRPTLTGVAGQLRSEGLIEYSRGEITICDRVGLKRRSCECYDVIKRHLDDLDAFDTSNMG